MVVTSTEFKTNLGKYFNMLDDGDITITRNGRKIAKLVKTEDDMLADIRSLFGILSETELSSIDDKKLKNVILEEKGKRYDRIN